MDASIVKDIVFAAFVAFTIVNGYSAIKERKEIALKGFTPERGYKSLHFENYVILSVIGAIIVLISGGVF